MVLWLSKLPSLSERWTCFIRGDLSISEISNPILLACPTSNVIYAPISSTILSSSFISLPNNPSISGMFSTQSITPLSSAYLEHSNRESLLIARIFFLNFFPSIGICPGCTTTKPGSIEDARSMEFFI